VLALCAFPPVRASCADLLGRAVANSYP
jgi:hypothetical protein